MKQSSSRVWRHFWSSLAASSVLATAACSSSASTPTLDTGVSHDGDMFYFGENEADLLPDTSRGALGTSKLGLFGALDLPTGQPIRVSALTKQSGQTILLAIYTVQTFPEAVTALSFRGCRPWQK